jgi:hypothetical protein
VLSVSDLSRRGTLTPRGGTEAIAVGVGSGHRTGEAMALCMRVANATSAARSRTSEQWFFCDTLLQRLSPHLEDMPFELGLLIQTYDPVVSQ